MEHPSPHEDIDINNYLTMYENFEGITLPLVNNEIKNSWIKQTYAAKGNALTFILNMNKYTKNFYTKANKVIAVTRSIIDYKNSNKSIGISIFVQDLVKFGEIAINNHVNDNETILILGANYEPVYSNKVVTNTILNKTKELLRNSSELLGLYTINHKKYFLISNAKSKYDFKVVTLIPYSIIDNKLSYISKISILLLVFLTFSSLLLSIFFSRLIISPLKKLTRAFKRFENGDFNASVIVKGEDEFAEICNGFNKMVSNLKILINEKYELDIQWKHAEFESLQSKINPHFFYNTISSLTCIIEKKDYENAYNMAQNLSDIFRYSLNKGRYVVSFAEELDHIKKYLWIQKFRFGEKYIITYDVDKETLNYPILRLTLQPIVENALIHGL